MENVEWPGLKLRLTRGKCAGDDELVSVGFESDEIFIL